MSKQPRSDPARGHNAPTQVPRNDIVSPLNHRAAFLVRLAQMRSFDEFHRHFAGLGVTPAGFSAFALIATNPGIRPGTIAEELRIKPSNVAVLVNGLVAEKLVERMNDENELRVSLLHATEAGKIAWKTMKRSADAVDAGFTENLSADESQQLVTLLQKLLHR